MQAMPLTKLMMQPTRWAFFLGLMTIVILLASMNYSLSLGYFMSFWLLSLIIVSAVTAWFNLNNIEWLTVTTPPVFLGQNTTFSLNLINRSIKNRYGIRLKTAAHFSVSTDLNAASQKTLLLPLQPAHRGWWAIPPLKLCSTFPLGLFRVSATLNIHSQVLVYPQPAPSDPHASDILMKSQSAPEDMHLFNGHRNYVTGDAIRHIDWKAYSRHQRMLIKTYAAETASDIWLDWQSTKALNDEEKIAILTRNLISANFMQSHYGLRLPNKVIKPGQGIMHFEKCLKALALL